MQAWLVVIRVQDKNAQPVERRFSLGLARPQGLGAEERLLAPPSIGIETLTNGLGKGGSRAPVGSIQLAGIDRGLAALHDLVWTEGELDLYHAADGDAVASLADMVLVARLTTSGIREDAGGRVTIELRDRGYLLDRKLALPRYAGTGGAEGPAELKDRPKPWAIGPQTAVEPVLVDEPGLIYQVHARGIAGIDLVTDKGVALTNGGDIETLVGAGAGFAELQSFDLSRSQWAGQYITWNAGGMFRLARKPVGLVVADFRGDAVGGYVEKPGAVIARVVSALHDGPAVGLDQAALDALDAAFPHAVKLFTDREGPRVSDWIETVATAAGAVWWIDWLGGLTVRLVDPAAAAKTLDGWRIAEVTRGPAWPRVKRLVLGYRVVSRVHSADELAEITADDITYTDGTPIEDLKPAEAGATKGAVVDDGSGVGNVRLPSGELVRDRMLLLKELVVSALPAQGAHDGQLVILVDPADPPPRWMQWDAASGSWLSRGPTTLDDVPDGVAKKAVIADVLANRPQPGVPYRIFHATDTGQWFRDDGTSWTLIASVKAGDISYLGGETIEDLKPAEPGATKGAVVDDGSGVGNVRLPDGTVVRNNMLLLKEVTVSQLPATGAHDGQLIILDDPSDGLPAIWYQWDAAAGGGAGAWVKRGAADLLDLDPPRGSKLDAVEDGATKSRVFYQSTPPSSPTLHDVWHDTSTGLMQRWDGAQWVPIGSLGAPVGTKVGNTDAAAVEDGSQRARTLIDPDGRAPSTLIYWNDDPSLTIQDLKPAEAGATKSRVFRQATAPANPTPNDLWYDTAARRLKRWDGAQWVEVGSLNTGALADRDDVDISAGHVTDGGVALDPDKIRNDALYVGADGRLHMGSPTGPAVAGQIDALQLPNAPAEAGATKGARAGVDLRDSAGNLLADADIHNQMLLLDQAGSLVIDGPGGPINLGQVTLTGLGGKALAFKDKIDAVSDLAADVVVGDALRRTTKMAIGAVNPIHISGNDAVWSGYRLWVGADRPQEAPFCVDERGKAKLVAPEIYDAAGNLVFDGSKFTGLAQTQAAEPAPVGINPYVVSCADDADIKQVELTVQSAVTAEATISLKNRTSAPAGSYPASVTLAIERRPVGTTTWTTVGTATFSKVTTTPGAGQYQVQSIDITDPEPRLGGGTLTISYDTVIAENGLTVSVTETVPAGLWEYRVTCSQPVGRQLTLTDNTGGGFVVQGSSAQQGTGGAYLPTTGGTITGNLAVAGDLTVSGNLVTVSSQQVDIGDNMLRLNAGLPATATPSLDAGIEIERGAEANVRIFWDETADRWTLSTPAGSHKIWHDGNAPATATRWPTWNEVTDKPSTFTPSAHTHDAADISGIAYLTAVRIGQWKIEQSGSDYTVNIPNTGGAELRLSADGVSYTTATLQIGGNTVWHDGNVPATATRWPTWGEVTGKPSTFTPSAHTHNAADITSGTLDQWRVRKVGVVDTRSVNDLPGFQSKAVQWQFKQNSSISLSPTPASTYSGVLHVTPWGDDSGGGDHQLAFASNGRLYHRYGTRAGGWGSWETIWTSGNDGSGSGLDADKLDGVEGANYARKDDSSTQSFAGQIHALQVKSISNVAGLYTSARDTLTEWAWYVQQDTQGLLLWRNGTGNILKIDQAGQVWTWGGAKYWHSGNDGSGSGLDADTLDGYEASEILNNKAVNYSATNLSPGWYTIAANYGNRAVARFALKDIASGRHQSIIFYASHKFGTHSEITILHSSRYSGTPLRYIRIKEGGTYDGALLQVYIDDAANDLAVYLLGDNFQNSGWTLVNWVPDGINPGIVQNFSALTNVAAQVDLDKTLDGGIVTTGEVYAGGDTTQYKVWHAGNDGTGSGLDADKLDGVELTDIATNQNAAIRKVAFGGYYMHSTIFDFNADVGHGWSYVNGLTNAPPHGDRQGGYRLRVALGSQFPVDGASGSYALELATARFTDASGYKYLWKRTKEGGSWTAWTKIAAGYADDADKLDGYDASAFALLGAGVSFNTLRLTGQGDVSPTSTGHAFQIGPDNGYNIAIDQNEIMARNNGATSTLHLNYEGGLVYVGPGGLRDEGELYFGGSYANRWFTRVTVGGVSSGWNTDVNANQLFYMTTSSGAYTVRLHTAGTSYLTGGNVGIGTSTPSYTLDVLGSARVQGALRINDENTKLLEGGNNSLRVQTNSGYVDIGPRNTGWSHFNTDRPLFYFNKGIRPSGSCFIYNTNTGFDASNFQLASGNGKGLRFWTSDNYKIYMSQAGDATWGGRAPGETTSDYNMYFRMTGGTNRGWVFKSGATPVAGIDAGGNIYAQGTVTAAEVTATSDERLKTEVADLRDCTAIVARLRPVTYRWKGASGRGQGPERVGLIAQEVLAVLPHVVHERGDGLLTLDYGALAAVLAGAIQEQQTVIAQQKDVLAALEATVADLRARVAVLENR